MTVWRHQLLIIPASRLGKIIVQLFVQKVYCYYFDLWLPGQFFSTYCMLNQINLKWIVGTVLV